LLLERPAQAGGGHVGRTAPLREAELVELCRGRLAQFRIPRCWLFVKSSFPLTPSGKVQKHVLRDHLVDAAAAGEDGGPGNRH
jgi:acyl-CoA synthetase (AMP-forming)/AMP-acid ligase II